MQYVGKTEREFGTRVKEDVRYIENSNVSQATGRHFSQRNHNITNHWFLYCHPGEGANKKYTLYWREGEGVEQKIQLQTQRDKTKLLAINFTFGCSNPYELWSCCLLSSPGPKPLAPNLLVPNPKPRGLGLTLNCSRPPPPPPTTTTTHPPTLKHEGGVPQQNTMSKNILEWSPLLLKQNKCQVDSDRKDMG